MLTLARRPRWIIATVSVVALAVLFVQLGLWQLRRHEERRLTNSVQAARLDQPPVDLESLLKSAGGEVDTLEYRRTWVAGTYRPELEVLVRNRVDRGRPGFHVLTPLESDGGTWVIVNRGWVPLDLDTPPVPASPPAGHTRVEGIVRLSQERPAFGPDEPAGELDVVSRIDVDRLSLQLPRPLAPVWVQAVESAGPLPVPLEPPDTSDPGPHLSYAVQWFSFALIGVVGYALLIRGHLRKRAPRP